MVNPSLRLSRVRVTGLVALKQAERLTKWGHAGLGNRFTPTVAARNKFQGRIEFEIMSLLGKTV